MDSIDHLIFVKLACIPNFSFLGELEVTFPGWVVGGWPESDNKTISVQPNLTGTGTGTELGKSTISTLAGLLLQTTALNLLGKLTMNLTNNLLLPNNIRTHASAIRALSSEGQCI